MRSRINVVAAISLESFYHFDCDGIYFLTSLFVFTKLNQSYVEVVSMMCMQLGVVTFLSAVAAVLTEPQHWDFDHLLR
jgi:hypothetical protein